MKLAVLMLFLPRKSEYSKKVPGYVLKALAPKIKTVIEKIITTIEPSNENQAPHTSLEFFCFSDTVILPISRQININLDYLVVVYVCNEQIITMK